MYAAVPDGYTADVATGPNAKQSAERSGIPAETAHSRADPLHWARRPPPPSPDAARRGCAGYRGRPRGRGRRRRYGVRLPGRIMVPHSTVVIPSGETRPSFPRKATRRRRRRGGSAQGARGGGGPSTRGGARASSHLGASSRRSASGAEGCRRHPLAVVDS